MQEIVRVEPPFDRMAPLSPRLQVGQPSAWFIVLVLAAPLLNACSLMARRSGPQPLPALHLDVDAYPLKTGQCMWPRAEVSEASAIQPAPVVQGGMEIVQIRGDARFASEGRFAAAWSGDGALLVTAQSKGLLVWNVAAGALRVAIPFAERPRVDELALAADASWAAVTGELKNTPVLYLVRLGPEPQIRHFAGLATKLRFSLDGRRLITKESIWDVATGARTALPDSWNAIVLPDGERVVDYGKTGVEVREIGSGKLIHQFPDGLFAVSGNGARVALLDSQSLTLFDISSGKQLRRLESIKQRTDGTRFEFTLSHDGTRVAVWRPRHFEVSYNSAESHSTSSTGSDSEKEMSEHHEDSYFGFLELWDTETGQRLWHLHDLIGSGFRWRFAPGSRFLVDDFFSFTLEVSTGKRVSINNGRVLSMSPDSRWVLGATERWPELKPVDATTAAPHISRAGLVVARSPDGERVASVDANGTLQLEWASDCTRLGLSSINSDDTVAFSPDGAYLFAGFHGASAIYTWRSDTGALVRKLWSSGAKHAHPLPGAGRAVFFSRWSWDPPVLHVLHVLDVLSGTELVRTQPPRHVPDSYYWGRSWPTRTRNADEGEPDYLDGDPIASTRDGRYLVTRDALQGSYVVSVWDLSNPAAVVDLPVPGKIGPLALSPDERFIAGGLKNGRVVLLAREGGVLTDVALLHDEVVALAFSRDGGRIASADMDGNVVVTGTKNGAIMGQLHLPFDHAVHLWFSPRGDEVFVDTARGLRITSRLTEMG